MLSTLKGTELVILFYQMKSEQIPYQYVYETKKRTLLST